MSIKRLFRASALLLALLVCSPAFAQVKVVTTLSTLASLTLEVGGPLVSVEALVGPTEDPHFVDAKPSLIVKLNRADLLIVNGLELEVGWLPTLQSGARNPKILTNGVGYLDASQAVRLLEVPVGKVDRSQGDIHPGGNPHYLFDPRACAQVAVAIAEKLAALDGKNAATYRANGQKVSSQLVAFATEQQKRFSALPPPQRRVVSYHKSLIYLYDWLQLTEVAALEPKPGVPPDPGHLARVLQTMKSQGVRVIVQEAFYPSNASKTTVGLVSGQVVVLPGGTRFAQGESTLSHLKGLSDELYAALSR